MEQWREIPDYEGLYEITKDGRVRSLGRIVCTKKGINKWVEGCNLKTHVLPNRYCCVVLSKCGKRKLEYVHRLVAKTFIPNPLCYPCINHKDENPMNNCVDNLEWCTQKYNSNYGTAKERTSKKMKNHEKLSNRVAQFDMNWNLIAEFPSLKEAERLTGIRCQNIGACCRGKRFHAGGFKWAYQSCAEKNVKARKDEPTPKTFTKLGKSSPLRVKKDGNESFTVYRSSEAASRGTGVPMGTIRRYISVGGIFHRRGHDWELLSPDAIRLSEISGVFDLFGEAVPQDMFKSHLLKFKDSQNAVAVLGDKVTEEIFEKVLANF